MAAIETGCRLGELLSLQWGDVNLDRREIRIRAEKTKDRDDRDISISGRLSAVLEMARTDPTGQPHGPLAHVFGEVDGQPPLEEPEERVGERCLEGARPRPAVDER